MKAETIQGAHTGTDIDKSSGKKILAVILIFGFVFLIYSSTFISAFAAGAAAAAASSAAASARRAAEEQSNWYAQSNNLLGEAIDYCNSKGGQLTRNTYSPLNEVRCAYQDGYEIIKLNGDGSILSKNKIVLPSYGPFWDTTTLMIAMVVCFLIGALIILLIYFKLQGVKRI